jgi:hypothetical protein
MRNMRSSGGRESGWRGNSCFIRGSNTGIVQNEQSVNLFPHARAQDHDALKTFALQECGPIAAHLQVNRRRMVEADDHSCQSAIRLAFRQFALHALAIEHEKETRLARVWTKHLDRIPTIEMQNHISGGAFAEMSLRVRRIFRNSFTTGEENGSNGKTSERQFFHDINKSLARNRFDLIRQR